MPDGNISIRSAKYTVNGPIPEGFTPVLPTTATSSTGILFNSSTSGKLIADISRIYTEEQKYDGSEGFDYKLRIFTDICKRVDLPQELYIKAFPTILKRLALSIYFSNRLSDATYDVACNYIRTFFEGAASCLAALNI
jgi:hypothetical protein